MLYLQIKVYNSLFELYGGVKFDSHIKVACLEMECIIPLYSLL